MTDQFEPARKRISAHPVLLWLGGALALAVGILICTVPLDFYQQLIFALFSLGFALLIRPEPDDASRYRRITLIVISCIATGRYLYWRIFESMGWFGSNIELSSADYFFSFGLLMAELYAWMVLYLGFFQTIWPLKRESKPLPADRSLWPTVDVFIPTYNEPLGVVTPSVLSARNLDWPKNRLNIYILDDGCREEFRQFALDVGVNYIERRSSEGAKAGNINHALAKTNGEYVAIFDCDHSPVRSFLTKTLGWFLHKKNLGLLQTPHLFFSPDPVERNLEVFRSVPNEGQLFYGLVQDGNDLWNSTFFCGSCAVMRREALESIGGIATDTVTEDAHTSLLMHRAQWESAYLNIPLAAGLATERLSAHVGQRIRWARGMVQIFRTDNPFLAKGLKLSQRLSYFNAMFHFFFSLPRIIFLTAPLAYLLLEAHVIQATAAMIAVFALPHIVQSHIANSALQGKFRHSFWAEVYETILATHIFWPTLKAMINPRLGKFNVTDKGSIITKDYFDWDTATPLFFVLLMNIAGFIVGVGRLLWWNVNETDTVIMTLCWTVYNMIILGAALAVARERKQLRTTVRIPRHERAEIILAGAKSIPGHTTDLSIVNAGLTLDAHHHAPLEVGDKIDIRLYDANRYFTFPCTVSAAAGQHIGVIFTDLNAEQLSRLVYFTHSREHSWDDWYGNCTPSRTLKSFFEVVRYGFSGLKKAIIGDHSLPKEERHSGHMISGWALVLFVVLVGVLFAPKTTHAGEFSESRDISFQQMGADTALALTGARPDWGINFRLRPDYLVEDASLEMQYAIPPELAYDFVALEVRLNGELLERIPINPDSVTERFEFSKAISPTLLNDDNNLSFHLADKGNPEACRNPANALINNKSTLKITSRPLKLANELSMLPLPLLDEQGGHRTTIPVTVFGNSALTADTIKAMGIVSSWFGVHSNGQTLNFPLTNELPQTHGIVFATAASHPDWLGNPDYSVPGIRVVTNPANEYGKLLVFSAATDAALVQAATAFASGQLALNGASLPVSDPVTLTPRKPYDAPAWIQSDKPVIFRDLVAGDALTVKGFGTDTIRMNFRLPPDLFSWKNEGIPVKFGYELNYSLIEKDGTIDLGVNEQPILSLPLFNVEDRPLSANKLNDLLMRPAAKASLEASTTLRGDKTVYLPLDQMIASNQLQFYFNIRPLDDLPNYCEVLNTLDMTSSIAPSSGMDLSKFHHFVRMPELRRFASHGFPFTRMADLSETAVVMPNRPGNHDTQAFLEMIAKFGYDTGYPALGVSVLIEPDQRQLKNKDILLIGTARSQPLLLAWKDEMPIAPTSIQGDWKVRSLSLKEKLTSWRSVNEKQERLRDVEHVLASSSGDLSAIFGFRSPLDRHRNVIAIASTTPYGLLQVSESLNDADMNSQIRNTLALTIQDRIETFDIAPGYFNGNLPVWSGLRWQLSNNMVYLLMLFILVVLLGAGFAYIVLSDRARRRLESD